jgi:hypothetical protein
MKGARVLVTPLGVALLLKILKSHLKPPTFGLLTNLASERGEIRRVIFERG